MDRAMELLEGPISDSLRNKIVELDQHRNPAGRQPVYGIDYGLGVGGAADYPGADLLGSNSYSTPGPFPKVEPGVKFRPLAFFDQKEVVQKASKVPEIPPQKCGNGTRVAGTQFYIRIPDTAIKLFVQGQVKILRISRILKFHLDCKSRNVFILDSFRRFNSSEYGTKYIG